MTLSNHSGGVEAKPWIPKEPGQTRQDGDCPPMQRKPHDRCAGLDSSLAVRGSRISARPAVTFL